MLCSKIYRGRGFVRGHLLPRLRPTLHFLGCMFLSDTVASRKRGVGGAVHCVLNKGRGATFCCRPLSANAADKGDLRPRDGALLTFLLAVLCLPCRNSGCMSVREATLA